MHGEHGQGLDKKNSHGFENIYMGGGRGEQWNACMFLRGDLSKTSTVPSHFIMQRILNTWSQNEFLKCTMHVWMWLYNSYSPNKSIIERPRQEMGERNYTSAPLTARPFGGGWFGVRWKMGEENKKNIGFFIVWLGEILVEPDYFLPRRTKDECLSNLEKNGEKKDSYSQIT